MRRTPLMLIGDGPQEATGLGRILRDLGTRIVQSDLPLEVISVGGPVPPVWYGWPHFPLDERLHRAEDWGAAYVQALWHSLYGARPGILWHIWDPGRIAAYRDLNLPVARWAYSAIDAPNGQQSVSGPAGEALAGWDRVIAYGRWASQIIQAVRPGAVSYLPHGLAVATFAPRLTEEEQAWVAMQIGPHRRREDRLIGGVATNQPRKDLALFFRTLGELRDRGWPVYGWLHTDVLTKAWSVVQLVEDCGLAKRVTVTMAPYTDRQLACLYQACAATIAPGLGEGFGYPIIESLASGTPVVHGDFGGGRELVPKREWRFPVREIRWEGIYGQQRPVFRPEDVANAVERVLGWTETVGAATVRAYCQGAVAHLAWEALWPRWYRWIKDGL